jgi:hypothetical protein
MKTKSERISARISVDLKRRIARVEEATGMSEAQQIEASVLALVAFFELHGYVANPMTVAPKAKPATIPTPTFPSTARPPQQDAHSVNESAPTADAVPLTRSTTPAQPDITKTRRGIRGMIAKEKGKS